VHSPLHYVVSAVFIGSSLLVSMTACDGSKATPEHPRSSPSGHTSGGVAGPQYKPVAKVCALLPDSVARNYMALPVKSKEEPQGPIAGTWQGRCFWQTDYNPLPPPHNGSVSADIYWFTPDKTISADAAQNAHHTFGLWLSGFTIDADSQSVNTTPLQGADEARSFAKPISGHESYRGELEARRGNVILRVIYDHDHAGRTATETSVRQLGQYLLSRTTGGA
jgi:hypothetical protein